jgi:hypothetical protein
MPSDITDPGAPNVGSPTQGQGTGSQNTVASNAISQLLSQIAPGLATDQAAYDVYQQQFNALPAQLNQQNAYQTAMANIQQQGIGISQQQNQLQQQSLGIQSAAGAQQQGIEQQQYGISNEQAALQQANALQSLSGQIATSGAQGATGQKQAEYTQNVGYALQQQMAGLGQQSEQVGYGEQVAQQGISAQNLALIAKANGLSEQQVVEQLGYGISQNQNQAITSAGQLLGQMGNLATGDISQAATALLPIAYASGLNPLAGG